MREGVAVTAAGVMQQLWLADAALAVHRRTLCVYTSLQTDTGVAFNLSQSVAFCCRVKRCGG